MGYVLVHMTPIITNDADKMRPGQDRLRERMKGRKKKKKKKREKKKKKK